MYSSPSPLSPCRQSAFKHRPGQTTFKHPWYDHAENFHSVSSHWRLVEPMKSQMHDPTFPTRLLRVSDVSRRFKSCLVSSLSATPKQTTHKRAFSICSELFYRSAKIATPMFTTLGTTLQRLRKSKMVPSSLLCSAGSEKVQPFAGAEAPVV